VGDQAEEGDQEKWEAMGVAPDREAIDGIMFVLEEPQEAGLVKRRNHG